MKWIDSPESSNVLRFGYDEDNRILGVEFKNGTLYHYYDIPETIFNAMKNAPSKGQFLAQSIKGVYRYARI
jgi:hypothetical protein